MILRLTTISAHHLPHFGHAVETPSFHQIKRITRTTPPHRPITDSTPSQPTIAGSIIGSPSRHEKSAGGRVPPAPWVARPEVSGGPGRLSGRFSDPDNGSAGKPAVHSL